MGVALVGVDRLKMKWLMGGCLFILGCLLVGGCDDGGGGGGRAEEVSTAFEKSYEQGPLVVRVLVDPTKISVTDTLRMRLEVEVDDGYKVTFPSLADALGEYTFEILDTEYLPEKLIENNRVLRLREYRLEPVVSGEHELPSLTFLFRRRGDEDNNEVSLGTEPVAVLVGSPIAGHDEQVELVDIKGVMGVNAQWSDSRWLWWLVGGAAVVLVLGGAVVFLLLRRSRGVSFRLVFRIAHEIAYEALEQLANEDLIAAGRVKEFYERVSGILRQYIEHRFELRAPERTTEEFLIEAGNTDRLSDEHKVMLAGFLQHCDEVKFACYEPAAVEIDKTLELARGFIDATRADDAQVDVTGQPEVVGGVGTVVNAGADGGEV